MYCDNTTCLSIPYCATAYDDFLLPSTSGKFIVPSLITLLLTLLSHAAPNKTLFDPQSRIASYRSAKAVVVVAFPLVVKDQEKGFQSGNSAVNLSNASHFAFLEVCGGWSKISPSSPSAEFASALDLFVGGVKFTF